MVKTNGACLAAGEPCVSFVFTPSVAYVIKLKLSKILVKYNNNYNKNQNEIN